MELIDATISVLLAARIHGNDAAVRLTAKRCAKRLPRSQRNIMFSIINDKEPRLYVLRAIQDVDISRLTSSACTQRCGW
ncbi:DUF7740 domain-containing protein [Metapseudomonas sp. CR3202]